MILKQQLAAQGATLFRWRSFLPLALVPVAIVAAFSSADFPDGHAGIGARVYDLFCILLSFAGLAFRAFTVASAAPRTSGRNTREQRADSLNVSGAYSIVRNPLYVANFIVLLGMLLFIKVWWLVALASLAYILYYERIVMAEEQYLIEKFAAEYTVWADRTPVMVPNFRLWRPASRDWSVRKILRQEYNGFYLIVAAFYLLEWCDRLLYGARQAQGLAWADMPGSCWTGFFLGGTAIFLTLRTLKKHTKLLNERV